MWANAQRNGRPAKYRWRPLFNPAILADARYYTLSHKNGANLFFSVTLSKINVF